MKTNTSKASTSKQAKRQPTKQARGITFYSILLRCTDGKTRRQWVTIPD